jgi:galactokinase
VERLAAVLPPRPLRLEEIAAFIGDSASTLARAADLRGSRFATYRLVARVRHVLGEAARVERAAAALATGDWPAFGSLLDASHASCRDDYEVSCPELEALVAAAKWAGALGARLTGAGFGGCTVNVVPTDAVPDFLARVERTYYAPRGNAAAREHCFVFTPSAGAGVLAV